MYLDVSEAHGLSQPLYKPLQTFSTALHSLQRGHIEGVVFEVSTLSFKFGNSDFGNSKFRNNDFGNRDFEITVLKIETLEMIVDTTVGWLFISIKRQRQCKTISVL